MCFGSLKNPENIYNSLLNLLSDFLKVISIITVPHNVLSHLKLSELGVLDFLVLTAPFLTLVLDLCEPAVHCIARLNRMKKMLLYIQTPHPWYRLVTTPILMLIPAWFRDGCLYSLNKTFHYLMGGYCKLSVCPHPFPKLSFIESQIYFLISWINFLYGSAVHSLLNYYVEVSDRPITSCIGQVIHSL